MEQPSTPDDFEAGLAGPLGSHEFRLLADRLPVAAFRADADGRVTYRNDAWCRLMTGSANVDRIPDLFHPDLQTWARTALSDLVSGVNASCEIEGLGRDGDTVLALNCGLVPAHAGHEPYLVGTLTDVTARVRLRRRAEHDALTGLLNREGLDERLTTALTDDPAGTLVLYVRLDGFAGVTADYGYGTGDRVLAEVGRRLRAAVRPADHVGRYGDDRFVIVYRNLRGGADPLDEDGIGRRLASALAEPVTWPGGAWPARASIGFARPQPGESPDQVARRAEESMHERARRQTSTSSSYLPFATDAGDVHGN